MAAVAAAAAAPMRPPLHGAGTDEPATTAAAGVGADRGCGLCTFRPQRDFFVAPRHGRRAGGRHQVGARRRGAIGVVAQGRHRPAVDAAVFVGRVGGGSAGKKRRWRGRWGGERDDLVEEETGGRLGSFSRLLFVRIKTTQPFFSKTYTFMFREFFREGGSTLGPPGAHATPPPFSSAFHPQLFLHNLVWWLARWMVHLRDRPPLEWPTRAPLDTALGSATATATASDRWRAQGRLDRLKAAPKDPTAAVRRHVHTAEPCQHRPRSLTVASRRRPAL